jgi:hypothetical protein
VLLLLLARPAPQRLPPLQALLLLRWLPPLLWWLLLDSDATVAGGGSSCRLHFDNHRQRLSFQLHLLLLGRSSRLARRACCRRRPLSASSARCLLPALLAPASGGCWQWFCIKVRGGQQAVLLADLRPRHFVAAARLQHRSRRQLLGGALAADTAAHPVTFQAAPAAAAEVIEILQRVEETALQYREKGQH